MNPDNFDARIAAASRRMVPQSTATKIHVAGDNQVLELTSGDYTIGPPAFAGQRLSVYAPVTGPTLTFPAAFQANGNNRMTFTGNRTNCQFLGVSLSGVLTWQYDNNTSTPSTVV